MRGLLLLLVIAAPSVVANIRTDRQALQTSLHTAASVRLQTAAAAQRLKDASGQALTSEQEPEHVPEQDHAAPEQKLDQEPDQGSNGLLESIGELGSNIFGTQEQADEALRVLQAATEKLEFDEFKLAKTRNNLKMDQINLEKDIYAINHPPRGMDATEVMNKGKVDTMRYVADRKEIPTLDEFVEEDKKRYLKAKSDYERFRVVSIPATAQIEPSSSSSTSTADSSSAQSSSISPPAAAAEAPPGLGSIPGKEHYDDFSPLPKRHWTSCPPCSNGTPQEIADWLESTDEGTEWLESVPGLDWLESAKGKQWLQTEWGAEWPFTQAGEGFFTSEWGQKFLQSGPGQTWLRTPPGMRWLREHKPWASSMLRLQNAALVSLLVVGLGGLFGIYVTPKEGSQWVPV
jgi:hypothetical protein